MIRIGQVILDQYRVDQVIGTGGMGVVYQVWDLMRNVPLAMKVLNSDVNEDPAQLRRFQREANALKKLSHPHIVPFYGFEISGDAAFLLESYVDGADLKQVLGMKADKRMPIPEALVYMKAICSALGYAHNFGVVHCDIKPGNVMIDQGGNIYLTDFGIARHAESTSTTFGGAGTPSYMAPEQIRSETVTPATDIYALGAMLFEMITGQRVFRGNEKESEKSGATAGERIRYAHQYLPPPDPRAFNPAIPPALAQVILRALAKNPAQRFQSTQEFFLAACNAAGMSPDQLGTRVSLPAGINVPPPSAAPTHPSQIAPTRQPPGYPPASQPAAYQPPAQPYQASGYGQGTPAAQTAVKRGGMPGAGLLVVVFGVIIVVGIIIILSLSGGSGGGGGDGGGTRPRATVAPPGGLPEPPSKTLPPAPGGGISPPNESDQDAQFTQDAMITSAAATVQAEMTQDDPDPTKEPTNTPQPTETAPPPPTIPPPPTFTPDPSPTIPPPLVSGATQVSSKDGMVIIYIESGEFIMGSQGDPQARADEAPQHRVFLDAYWIDKTEVTNAMFRSFANATGYRTEAELSGSAKVYNGAGWDNISGADWQHPRGPSSNLNGMDNYPVVMVSYSDAGQYCSWVGGRLPTEAEWEKASRGTSGQIYPWGNQNVSGQLANYNNMVGRATAVTEYSGGHSTFGLLNMSGNVWEWVIDWYDPSYYRNSPSSNPYGASSSGQGMRTLRGGSWTSPAIDIRSATRSATTPDNAKDNIGFRCVRFP